MPAAVPQSFESVQLRVFLFVHPHTDQAAHVHPGVQVVQTLFAQESVQVCVVDHPEPSVLHVSTEVAALLQRVSPGVQTCGVPPSVGGGPASGWGDVLWQVPKEQGEAPLSQSGSSWLQSKSDISPSVTRLALRATGHRASPGAHPL